MLKHSPKNMKLSILLTLFGISQALPSSQRDYKNPFVETKKISFPNGTLVSQKYRFYKVKSYIGLIVPKDIGEKTVVYKLCYKKNNCTSGEESFFGTINEPEISKIPIDKENLVIHQFLISRSNRNIYDAVQWTNIQLTGVRIYPLVCIAIKAFLRY